MTGIAYVSTGSAGSCDAAAMPGFRDGRTFKSEARFGGAVVRDNVFGHASAVPAATPWPGLRKSAAGLLGTAVLLAACSPSASTGPGSTTAANPTGAGPGGSAGAGASIDATESDFKIDVSAANAAPGPVTFHIKNTGSQLHEFVVIKTDTPGDQLPQATDAPEVDENASGLTVVDEVEDIAAGAASDLDVTLDPGHYVLICNVSGHYQLGMHTDFTVGP
jgi:uncharacterized cupredoxin-like copper-binding protein